MTTGGSEVLEHAADSLRVKMTGICIFLRDFVGYWLSQHGCFRRKKTTSNGNGGSTFVA